MIFLKEFEKRGEKDKICEHWVRASNKILENDP